jgi:ectoine hydroxylase-related dioxygenase (phytanoyl-CoA dioxygenase family)
MDTVFTDSATEGEFEKKGYVVRPFLDEHEVRTLKQLHEALPPDGPGDFYATVFSRDSDYRGRVSEGIAAAMKTRLAALFPNHELCFAVFVTKRPNTRQGALPLHRDYSFVDTKVHRAVHLWCPLVDVNETNACLQVVSGSHTLVKSPYAVNEYPQVFGQVMELLRKDFTTAVPMAAGSVIAYESRLFHGSGENRSKLTRPACVAILLPMGVRPRVYVWNGERPTTFDILEVTADFLLQMERGAPIKKPYPPGVNYLESAEYPVDSLQPEDLLVLKRRWSAAAFVRRYFERTARCSTR